MALKQFLKSVVGMGSYAAKKLLRFGPVYNQDGLRSIHDHSFIQDPSFSRAYGRGVSACDRDYKWHWRVHIGLWAAFSASKLEGDFVECGVNRGFLSSAIMDYLDWDSLKKTFYLLDTFSGIDDRFLSENERKEDVMERNKWRLRRGFYTTNIDSVRENFSTWQNVQIVAGAIPETLDAVKSEKVAYLHLDMNCVPPEVAALEHFWDRLVPGGFVLLDDYAYSGHKLQKNAMDEIASNKGVKIVSLPTGQGLLLKPA